MTSAASPTTERRPSSAAPGVATPSAGPIHAPFSGPISGPGPDAVHADANPSWIDGFARRAVLGRFERLRDGVLVVHDGGTVRRFGHAAADGLEAHLRVEHPRFWRALAFRGSVGAGEAFAEGVWSSDEPTDVVRVMVRNQAALADMERGLARLARPALAWYHARRDNTRRGSAANIAAHYDLSNEFFALFLDPTLTYSSAYFVSGAQTLEEAQLAKIDRLLDRLALAPGDRLLEIGTGWGALACRAAATRGVRVTTTTLSREQHAFATARVAEAGLSDRVEVLLSDYRDLTGTYDGIVSVEMIEAVGARHYPTYFAKADQLLAPGGRFAVQAITIRDQHFERARREVDFIQRHIFPGCCIPSVTALGVAARDRSTLRLVGLEDFGPDYARTLRLWREALRERRSDALVLGFHDQFLRLFDFYFSYCEGGFTERHISVAHLVYSR